MLPDGLTDCVRCGQPARGVGGARRPNCEPARCGGCGRFISAAQAHDFGSCDECLDNALPDSNEGLPTDGWGRVLRTSTRLEAA